MRRCDNLVMYLRPVIMRLATKNGNGRKRNVCVQKHTDTLLNFFVFKSTYLSLQTTVK